MFRSMKNIIKVGVSLLLVIGIVAACVALFNTDTMTIGPGKFERGEISLTGEYVESTQAVYTKEAFPCQGLRIVPNFEATGTFDVFFYDVNDNLVDSEVGLNSTYVNDVPEASLARVVYHPGVPEGENEAEWSIGFFEVRSYAKHLTITVSKDQTEYKSSLDLYEADTTKGAFTVEDVTTVVANESVQASKAIELDGNYDFYRIYVRPSVKSTVDVDVAFYGEDGSATMIDENGRTSYGFAHTFSASELQEESWVSVIVEVPDDATHLRVQGPIDAEYRIYGVQPK